MITKQDVINAYEKIMESGEQKWVYVNDNFQIRVVSKGRARNKNPVGMYNSECSFDGFFGDVNDALGELGGTIDESVSRRLKQRPAVRKYILSLTDLFVSKDVIEQDIASKFVVHDEINRLLDDGLIKKVTVMYNTPVYAHKDWNGEVPESMASTDEIVLGCIEKSDRPLRICDIESRTKLTKMTVKYRIQELKKAGVIRVCGFDGRRALYEKVCANNLETAA